MNDIKLGHPITGPAERDAVHMAIVPLIAGDDRLYPGVAFHLQYGSTDVALYAEHDQDNAIGIIDPFWKSERWDIGKGDRVWGLLYPNTVTGMRHHWSHPAFDNAPPPVSPSEEWLRGFADRWNMDFDQLISAATSPYDDWATARGIDLHGASELGEDEALFWHHLEQHTGKVYPQAHRGKMIWSCSC